MHSHRDLNYVNEYNLFISRSYKKNKKTKQFSKGKTRQLENASGDNNKFNTNDLRLLRGDRLAIIMWG